METNVTYWEIHYISCEGNTRWTIAKCPSEWEEYDVKHAIMADSRIGDDPAEITECSITYFDNDYSYDFTLS